MASEKRKSSMVMGRKLTWAEYHIYDSYLRIPRMYVDVLFKNYDTPYNMVLALPTVFNKVHQHILEVYKMHNEIGWKEKFWEAAQIPPTYYGVRPAICASSKDQGDYNFVVENIGKARGITLYLHSEQMEGAMNAGVAIMKAAIEAKIPHPFCVSYPNLVDSKKDTWSTKEEDVLGVRANKADILLIYAAGCEYAAGGFSANHLVHTINERVNKGKSTVVVSSLNPGEYKKRYGKDVEGVSIEFKDDKIKQTLKDLRRSLENG